MNSQEFEKLAASLGVTTEELQRRLSIVAKAQVDSPVPKVEPEPSARRYYIMRATTTVETCITWQDAKDPSDAARIARDPLQPWYIVDNSASVRFERSLTHDEYCDWLRASQKGERKNG